MDLHPAAAVDEGTVFGGVGHEFMHDQSHHGQGRGRQQHLRPGQDHPFRPAAQIGVDLRRDQGTQGGRFPVLRRQLVVRPRQRLDAPADDLRELLDAGDPRPALDQQCPDEAEDVADPVVQLGDQQFLPLAGRPALLLRLVGQAQHHLHQRDPQGVGDAQVGLRPGFRLAVHRLLPRLEALARGQALPVGAGFHGLVRIAGPGDGAERLLAEEDDVVARLARHRDGQHAGGALGEIHAGLVDLPDLAGGEDAAGVRAVEHAHQPEQFLRRRGAAVHEGLAAQHDGEAVAADVVADLAAQPPQILHGGGAVRHHRHDAGVEQTRLGLVGLLTVALNAFQKEGEHLAVQLRRRASLQRQTPRHHVVAGEQAPQLAAAQDRHRQRGGDAHVAQILAMDGRHAAQDAHRQVERLALRSDRRQDGRGRSADIVDAAQPVPLVQRTGLLRDVRGRVAQTQIGGYTAHRGFRDHLPRAVAVEAVDHHPVEAGQRPQLPRRLAAAGVEVGGALKPSDHGADHGADVQFAVRLARLRLDDDRLAGQMDRDVQRQRAGRQLQAEGTLHRSVDQRELKPPADGVKRLLLHHLGQGKPQQRVGLHPQPRPDVGRGVLDDPVRRQCDQESAWLDGPDEMDRLPVAIAQVYATDHCRSAPVIRPPSSLFRRTSNLSHASGQADDLPIPWLVPCQHTETVLKHVVPVK
ncbi:hypothetical protein FBY14_1349 [Azospirillum brasilense]|nr:hypothetical protein FBY14_1349 [Azospirillum brasilense]